jgi:hypothetical protein
MIFVQGVRFSCKKCLKGHRTGQCNHITELVELKVKGRPLSQCGTCRNKRKDIVSRHNSCKCGDKPPSSVKTIVTSILQSKPVYFPGDQTLKSESLDPAKMQDQIDSQAPFVFTIETKSETKVCEFVASHLEIQVVHVPVSLDNPCKCHYGGECVCSENSSKRPGAVTSSSNEAKCCSSSKCACSASGKCSCSPSLLDKCSSKLSSKCACSAK